MQKNDSPDTNNKNLSTLTSDIKHLAEDVDFKPYLEAVIAASHRNRSILYILIVALIAIFAAYRNTANPDWLNARLQNFQTAYSCMQGKENTNNSVVKAKCNQAIEYTGNFMYQAPTGVEPSISSEQYNLNNNSNFLTPTPTPNTSPSTHTAQSSSEKAEELRQLQHQIDMLIRQRTENLSIRFPLLGLAMDMNDLGWISGFTLFVLMYIFLLTLRREVDNLKNAKTKAEQSKNKDNLELILMAQVFSSPPKSKTGTNRGFYVFFAIPPLLLLLILITDIGDRDSIFAGHALLIWWKFWLQMIVEILCYLGTVWMALRCGRKWQEVDITLNDIQTKHKNWELHTEQSSTDEQETSGKPQVTANLKLRYTVALLLAGLFIASTTILLGRVNSIFRPLFDITTVVTVLGAVLGTIVALLQLILDWGNDDRDAKTETPDSGEKELKTA